MSEKTSMRERERRFVQSKSKYALFVTPSNPNQPTMKSFHSFCLLISLLLTASLAVAENTNDAPSKIVLRAAGKPLAQYAYVSVPFKPYIDELRTPSGKNILRDAPWDHLHHHSLMYAIRVNDCNFWEETNEDFGKQVTKQCRHVVPPTRRSPRVQRLRKETISFGDAIESTIDWNAPQAKTLLKEQRHIRVGRGNDVTLIDWRSTFKSVEDTVLGGPGHYYGLGMRFVEEMDKGGRFFDNTGKQEGEVTAGGERLTPCRWMAYTAKVEGEPVTVAVFDHPSNPEPMTAFTMGDTGQAFAYMSATMNMHRKQINLRAGQTFAVKYRVAVWDGEVSPETVEEQYREFVR